MKNILLTIIKIILCLLGTILIFVGIVGFITGFLEKSIFAIIFCTIFSLLFISGGASLFYVALRKIHLLKSESKENLQPSTIAKETDALPQTENNAIINTNDTAIKMESVPSAQYIESDNTIYRTDGKTISDEEIPYLMQVGYKNALTQEKNHINPKFSRTEQEEELCFQFMQNHSSEIQKHTDSFENAYRLAYAEEDLNKKIILLEKTIALYEKEKNWFYKTKGGTIYFQDFYEHLHNSKNNDFSYIEPIENYLEYNIHKRDYIIPEIHRLIVSLDGILQKDIYKYLPDEPKSDIQRIIRELEHNNIITRTKKSNSYFLTLKTAKTS